MNLKDILSQITAPKGYTSVIAGLENNDFSVIPHQKGLGATIEIAEEQIKTTQTKLDECKSDWAYWSILGDLTYWQTIKNILEGASIVGEDNMPEVKFESKAMVVMDTIAEVGKFGQDVLDKCKEQIK